MPASQELPQQIPPPGNSLGAKAQGWGQIFGENLRVCVGGRGVMDGIDTCIIKM